MGCGSSSAPSKARAPEELPRPLVYAAVTKPTLPSLSQNGLQTCEPSSGSGNTGGNAQEASFETPPGSAALRASSAADSRAGPPAVVRSPRAVAATAGWGFGVVADDDSPPPPPMAPPVAVMPPMATRPPSASARDGLASPLPSTPARTISGLLVEEDDSPRSRPFDSPRPFDPDPQLMRPRSASLSTASSTPRRFPPVSPSLRGLREDIFEELFDEEEEMEDQAVQMEIQGLMTNIHLDLFSCALDDRLPSPAKGSARRSRDHSLSLPISTEEERLMQEILEDEED